MRKTLYKVISITRKANSNKTGMNIHIQSNTLGSKYCTLQSSILYLYVKKRLLHSLELITGAGSGSDF